MQPGHGSGLESVPRPRADDNVRPLYDPVYEVSKLAQVIAAVGVRQHDDVAAGHLQSAPDRHAIPSLGF